MASSLRWGTTTLGLRASSHRPTLEPLVSPLVPTAVPALEWTACWISPKAPPSKPSSSANGLTELLRDRGLGGRRHPSATKLSALCTSWWTTSPPSMLQRGWRASVMSACGTSVCAAGRRSKPNTNSSTTSACTPGRSLFHAHFPTAARCSHAPRTSRSTRARTLVGFHVTVSARGAPCYLCLL